MPNVEQAVTDVLNQILTDAGGEPRSFQDADQLTADLGFDSLDLAVAVVTLERKLGKDPFRDGSARARTFGEFVKLYQ